jgi:ElaB/YqjD/DUF883 family membrane-anchored ribosome-binding protein
VALLLREGLDLVFQFMKTELNTEQIVKDLKAVVHDAEELAVATAGEVGENVREARVRLGNAIASAKQSCEHCQKQSIKTAKAADKVVHEHPYKVAGVAFGLGALLGVLLTRKS